MVGNEFVGPMSRTTKYKRQTEPRKAIVFSNVIERPFQPQLQSNISPSNLFVEAPTFQQSVFNTPAIHRPLASYFPKTFIVSAIIVLVLLLSTAIAVIEKQPIMSLLNRATIDTKVLLQKAVKPKAVVPIVNPQQIIIHSSDYYSDVAAIMTQTITLELGSNSQAVGNATLANWLTITNKDKLTYIAVNKGDIAMYIKQFYAANGATVSNEQSIQSPVNQIANNVLKAKGMTILLPQSD